jgi:hypothetical protein
MTTDMTTRSGGSASPSGERLQDAASGLVDQAGRTAEAQASRTMTQAGDALSQLAGAVRSAGSDMRTNRPEIANVADTAADQVERAATYLRQHDAGEALEAATDFARRQPVLVMGAALLAGLAVGRFVRSASDSQSSRHGYYGTSGSSLRSGTYAGMRSRYGDAGYGNYDSDRYMSDSSFENRTSELAGTGATASDRGSSSTTRSQSTGAQSTSTPRNAGGSSKRSSSSRTSTSKES